MQNLFKKVTKGQIHDVSISQNGFHEAYYVHNFMLLSKSAQL